MWINELQVCQYSIGYKHNMNISFLWVPWSPGSHPPPFISHPLKITKNNQPILHVTSIGHCRKQCLWHNAHICFASVPTPTSVCNYVITYTLALFSFPFFSGWGILATELLRETYLEGNLGISMMKTVVFQLLTFTLTNTRFLSSERCLLVDQFLSKRYICSQSCPCHLHLHPGV